MSELRFYLDPPPKARTSGHNGSGDPKAVNSKENDFVTRFAFAGRYRSGFQNGRRAPASKVNVRGPAPIPGVVASGKTFTRSATQHQLGWNSREAHEAAGIHPERCLIA